MNKILFIDNGQFGSLSVYYWSKYLCKKNNIYFFGRKGNKNYCKLDEVKIIEYESLHKNKILSYISFLIKAANYIKQNNFELVIITYHRFCFLYKVINPLQKMVLNVRTIGVKKTYIGRIIYNINLYFDSLFYNNISILDQSIMKIIPKNRNIWIIPLGSDKMISKPKNYNDPAILYVGTFNRGNIDEMIRGINLYFEKSQNPCDVYIIGDGLEYIEKKLNYLISSLRYRNYYHIEGRKNYNELVEYFDKCNIGISWVPITNYYNNQPPTKTYEYINSGLICVATATEKNKEIINKSNGILCLDNKESLAEALETVISNMGNYEYDKITSNYKKTSWEYIVNNYVDPMIQNIIAN